MITINIEKAKEIWKNKLRQERKPLLEKLDVEFQRALETGSNTTLIVEEKNRLRDITKNVDDCNTIDQIRAVDIQSSLNTK